MEFSHKSVLLKESVEGLNIDPSGTYIDCTAGGGGHSLEIAKRLRGGRLICFDRDSEAIEAAKIRLKDYSPIFVNRNFADMKEVLRELGIEGADGILMDLGVSSYQLDNRERGFSYHDDAPLDMRMSGEGESARDVVNEYEEKELIRILQLYGEEKFAASIARGIVKAREQAPIETTAELAEIIRTHVPERVRNEKNPCRKTFQAIRIEVNRELDALQTALSDGFELLNKGGRMAVITFHSLEDRIVKNAYREYCTGCTCPPEFPVCVCGKKPRAALVNKKPVTASEQELEENQRSRSAKLRILEKL
ncbi:MAG: 16S rRNA (cytosine(1402)-N(4))-methyltransferase RsmH [Firmicutes bacterium]|nr:16S rRNA (cytosine(1402)-N(4))-methyltransferase RsmH [[Eubacterium] siraeum]MCM1486842.1 16S rRNA (cytosine(1402)-N(4))-methyltransferase RsmH [Bacillota bacterium]